jgi:hypothetical protein
MDEVMDESRDEYCLASAGKAVTPSRTVGVPPPLAASSTLSKTMRASSVMALKVGRGI